MKINKDILFWSKVILLSLIIALFSVKPELYSLDNPTQLLLTWFRTIMIIILGMLLILIEEESKRKEFLRKGAVKAFTGFE